MNVLGLVGGFILTVSWCFLVVGVCTEFWRENDQGSLTYGLWSFCLDDGHDCLTFEDFFTEYSSKLRAAQAFGVLSLFLGLCALPVMCVSGAIGSCLCLVGRLAGIAGLVLCLLTAISAIICFAIMYAGVQDDVEDGLGTWRYGYSFGLFVTGWILAILASPFGLFISEEE